MAEPSDNSARVTPEILIVVSDCNDLTTTHERYQALGYKVHATNDVDQALEIMAEHGRIAAVLSDQLEMFQKMYRDNIRTPFIWKKPAKVHIAYDAPDWEPDMFAVHTDDRRIEAAMREAVEASLATVRKRRSGRIPAIRNPSPADVDYKTHAGWSAREIRRPYFEERQYPGSMPPKTYGKW